MNIIGRKKIYLTISGAAVLASIAAIAVFGLRPGIDFTGGTLWQFSFSEGGVTRERTADFFRDELQIANAVITPEPSSGSFLVRIPELTEEMHQDFSERIRLGLGNFEELRFETIGAAIGSEIRTRSITAFLLVLIAISLYIAFAFRKVSRPVSSWKYGAITLATLFHDAIIPAGLFAVLGVLRNVEIDANFIVAILVVMGFSVHDTIVVFDRIRENLNLRRSEREEFQSLVNTSVNQTIARSVNTSLTLVLVLVALSVFGAPSLRYFVLAIMVGTVVGTYSSIFVASPLLTIWKKK
jgi:preprotein translocase subunit SecF